MDMKICIIRSTRGRFDLHVTEHWWSSEKSNKFYRVGDSVPVPDHPCAFSLFAGRWRQSRHWPVSHEITVVIMLYCFWKIRQPELIWDCPSCGLGTLHPVYHSRFSLVHSLAAICRTFMAKICQMQTHKMRPQITLVTKSTPAMRRKLCGAMKCNNTYLLHALKFCFTSSLMALAVEERRNKGQCECWNV